jgi:hypothetical protein
MSGFVLALAFDSDDPEFVRGAEVGSTWEITRRFADGEDDLNTLSEPGELFLVVHATNAEMMLRIAEARELQIRSEEIGDGWFNVFFTRTASA